MFEVSVEHTFAAAHQLRNYHGKCENLHGHNYKVQVRVTGPELDEAGMLVDFVLLKKLVREASERLDHQYLNAVAPFDTVNPSAENIAKYLYEEISGNLTTGNAAELDEVRVWETDIQFACYRAPRRKNDEPAVIRSSS
jgi:6-pyruvoyltetrahydropterin/6-carboxytetrahydropterin synthase